MDNGLAANESSLYGFFEDRDGSIWMAGDEGVSHVLPDPGWFRTRSKLPPQVTGVEADGKAFSLRAPEPARLPSDTKVLRILAGSLGAPRFRDFPLRYRLLPRSNEWSLSRDGTMEFQNLNVRKYVLEVGYTGDDAGLVVTYPFEIGTPINWSWMLGLLAAAGVLIPVIRYAPWLERTRFRVSRWIFLLRRSY